MKLIMGSYVHGAANLALSTRATSTPASTRPLDYNALRLRWFDQTLKGLDTGILDEPPITIFVMGGGDGRKNAEGQLNHGGYWRTERGLAAGSRAQDTTYYLHADGSLTTEQPAPTPRRASTASTRTTRSRRWAATSRRRPRCCRAAASISAGGRACRGTATPCRSRCGATCWCSRREPLAEDVEVTGPITVKLWAASSAVDTDFTAKLIDVYPSNEDYPDGYDLNISDSIIRARYRDSFSEPKLMTPGEVYAITIIPYPTSNVFKAGHRIRVDISSSNFPRFDVNPNTGEPLGKHRRTVVASRRLPRSGAAVAHRAAPHPSLGSAPS